MRIHITVLVYISILFSIVPLVLGTPQEKISERRLVSGLMSADAVERNKALVYVSRKNIREVAPLLVNTCIDNSGNDRGRAAYNAIKLLPTSMQVPAVTTLIDRHPSFLFKAEVLKHSGNLKNRKLVIPVSRQLTSPFKSIREAAAKALRTIGDDRMYPIILQLSLSENPAHRIHAVEAMSYLYDVRFYGFLIDMMKDPNKSVRIQVLGALHANKLEDALYLIRRAAKSDVHPDVRVNAIQVIGSFRDRKAQYILIRQLSNSDAGVRLAAAQVLYEMRTQSSAYTIADRLKYETVSEIRHLLLDILQNMRKTGSLAALKVILEDNRSHQLRCKAASVIALARDSRGVPLLLRALEDSDFRVRAESSYALRYFSTQRVIKALVNRIIKDKKRYVRSAALYALKKIDERKSIQKLFDQFALEQEPVFREQLRSVLRILIDRHI